MTDGTSKQPETLWDHDTLVQQMVENGDHVKRMNGHLQAARATLIEALQSHDQTAINHARFQYETHNQAYQEFVRAQEGIMHRLEHLENQGTMRSANTLAEALVRATKWLAIATVVLAVSTVVLVFVTAFE